MTTSAPTPNLETDVIIVGAGPVGLACAIEVGRTGKRCLVVDKGALVNSLTGYPTNMEFFSTPDLIEIGGYPLVSSRYKPIREEAIDYYRRVASKEKLRLLLYESVEDLSGEKENFTIKTSKRTISCKAVVIATGFFDQPNLLNIPGEDLPHVSHYFREAFTFTGRNVCIVGAKNSAALAALQCHRRGAHVTMILRGEQVGPNVKYWIRPDLMNRIEEGSINALFNSTITHIRESEVDIQSPEGAKTLSCDVLLALTVYHPDYTLLKKLSVDIADDHAATPLYNEETFESSRPGVFLAGTVCGGRHTSRWFIENGRHHAKCIANALA